VGRTGRAGEAGTAVSLFAPSDLPFADHLERELAGGGAAPAADGAAAPAPVLRPFERITRAAVEGLRYRAEDVARSVTKSVVREARAKDLKAELLNSKRLAAFFEDRPADLQLLRHDRPLAAAAAAGAAAPHLKHLPPYLRDPALQGKSFIGGASTRGTVAGYAVPRKKRRAPEGVDPVKGFTRAPKRGADRL
jgi:ATP-dependent RNA helicase DDX56/DBP9